MKKVAVVISAQFDLDSRLHDSMGSMTEVDAVSTIELAAA